MVVTVWVEKFNLFFKQHGLTLTIKKKIDKVNVIR